MEDKEDIIQVVTATMEAREDTTLTVMATKEDKVATILVEEVVKEGREGITRDMEAREDKVDIIRVEVEGREDIILDKEAKEDKVDIILAEVEAMEGSEDIIPEETATKVDREGREGTILEEMDITMEEVVVDIILDDLVMTTETLRRRSIGRLLGQLLEVRTAVQMILLVLVLADYQLYSCSSCCCCGDSSNGCGGSLRGEEAIQRGAAIRFVKSCNQICNLVPQSDL